MQRSGQLREIRRGQTKGDGIKKKSHHSKTTFSSLGLLKNQMKI